MFCFVPKPNPLKFPGPPRLRFHVKAGSWPQCLRNFFPLLVFPVVKMISGVLEKFCTRLYNLEGRNSVLFIIEFLPPSTVLGLILVK